MVANLICARLNFTIQKTQAAVSFRRRFNVSWGVEKHMADDFVHENVTATGVISSVCRRCHRVIAFSSNVALLRLSELAHKCLILAVQGAVASSPRKQTRKALAKD